MLKVGQKVRVLMERGGHGFDIGEELEVILIDHSLDRGDFTWSFLGTNGEENWWLDEGEVELID